MANGMFQQFGMDFDPEAELRKRRQANMQQGLGLVQNISDNSGVQGAANIGAILGAGLGGARLTPQQEQLTSIQKEAKTRYDEWLKANPDASEEDKALGYNDTLSSAAVLKGRPDLGAQLMSQTAEQRRAKAQQKLELERLGIELNRSKVGLKQDEHDLSKSIFLFDVAKSGESVTIWKAGEKDPSKGFQAKIDPRTGNAITADGELTGDQYTRNEPLDPLRTYGRGSGSGGGSGLNKSTSDKLKAAHAGVLSSAQTLREFNDILREGMTATGSQRAALAESGKIISASNRWANNVASMYGVLSGQVVTGGSRDYDVSTAEGRAAYIRDNRTTLAGRLNIAAEQADKLLAIAVPLTYARLRSEGETRPTKADFDNALQATGAGLNDPNTMRDVMLGGLIRSARDIDNQLRNYPDEEIIPAPERQRLLREMEQTNEAWAKPWPGTTPPPAAATVVPKKADTADARRQRLISIYGAD